MELKDFTPIQAIRALSGMFQPETAVDRLAFVNLLARLIVGDAQETFVVETMKKCGINLIIEKRFCHKCNKDTYTEDEDCVECGMSKPHK